ncbi:MAG: hypothetical protein K9N36_09630 [Candidatus Marinimicrobia bacterium]|nr:hypothetical protein [Candidatus Neomarinimicrobiota bacterium]
MSTEHRALRFGYKPNIRDMTKIRLITDFRIYRLSEALGKLVNAIGPQLNNYINQRREQTKFSANEAMKENEPDYSEADEIICCGQMLRAQFSRLMK